MSATPFVSFIQTSVSNSVKTEIGNAAKASRQEEGLLAIARCMTAAGVLTDMSYANQIGVAYIRAKCADRLSVPDWSKDQCQKLSWAEVGETLVEVLKEFTDIAASRVGESHKHAFKENLRSAIRNSFPAAVAGVSPRWDEKYAEKRHAATVAYEGAECVSSWQANGTKLYKGKRINAYCVASVFVKPKVPKVGPDVLDRNTPIKAEPGDDMMVGIKPDTKARGPGSTDPELSSPEQKEMINEQAKELAVSKAMVTTLNAKTEEQGKALEDKALALSEATDRIRHQRKVISSQNTENEQLRAMVDQLRTELEILQAM